MISLDIEKPLNKIPGVIYQQVDIRDFQAVQKIAFDSLHVDILINNAAMQHINSLKELKEQEIKDMLDTNILGTLNVTKAFIPLLKDSLIINIGSVHSETPRTDKIPYDMSKAALSIFTKEIALELAEQGTRAICVEFGAVQTSMNNNFANENEKKEAISKQVIQHMMSTEECAKMVFELTTDKFAYMTGEVIKYDCGRSLK